MVTSYTYEFTGVTANHTISAEFSNMVNVTIKLSSNSPFTSGAYKIRYGITDTVSATPSTWTTIGTPSIAGTPISVEAEKYLHVEVSDISSGYSFVKWHVTDVEEQIEDDQTNPVVLQMVSGTYVFELYMSTTTFTITASAGTGGTITPSGTVSVAYGANQSFTITADTANGYRISRILVDGSPIPLE